LQNDLKETIVYPDEIEDTSIYEGTKKQVTVNIYKRDTKTASARFRRN